MVTELQKLDVNYSQAVDIALGISREMGWRKNRSMTCMGECLIGKLNNPKVKKNPIVKLKDPKRAIGETGQVYYPRKKKWMRGKIIGISDIRRAPFLSMSGYSEIPIYKVKLYTGEVIETSPIMMREFRHRKLKSNPLISYYKKEVIK
jgi:hypothetical protein